MATDMTRRPDTEAEAAVAAMLRTQSKAFRFLKVLPRMVEQAAAGSIQSAAVVAHLESGRAIVSESPSDPLIAMFGKELEDAIAAGYATVDAADPVKAGQEWVESIWVLALGLMVRFKRKN
jgi:hypothetical protein